MAKRRNKNNILKTMFDKRPLLKKEKIYPNCEAVRYIPINGKIEVIFRHEKNNTYNCFISPYEMYFDKYNSYNYTINNELDIHKIYVEDTLNDVAENNSLKIEINRNELSDYYKKWKEDKKVDNSKPYVIETEYGRFGVNPDYLLNMIDWCGTNYILVNPDKIRIGCIFSYSDDYSNLAIVLPCRV